MKDVTNALDALSLTLAAMFLSGLLGFMVHEAFGDSQAYVKQGNKILRMTEVAPESDKNVIYPPGESRGSYIGEPAIVLEGSEHVADTGDFTIAPVGKAMITFRDDGKVTVADQTYAADEIATQVLEILNGQNPFLDGFCKARLEHKK